MDPPRNLHRLLPFLPLTLQSTYSPLLSLLILRNTLFIKKIKSTTHAPNWTTKHSHRLLPNPFMALSKSILFIFVLFTSVTEQGIQVLNDDQELVDVSFQQPFSCLDRIYGTHSCICKEGLITLCLLINKNTKNN